MEKNVSVIDETGKFIGTTYPKRARGLVKSGRARYVFCDSMDNNMPNVSTRKNGGLYNDR